MTEQLNCTTVGNVGKKPIIGILGGVGSGKSTIAAEFAKLGCKVIDADKIAHELLEQKAVKEKILSLSRAEQLIKRYNRQNQVKAIVLDMPLLVEVGWDKRCDKLIFVDCRRQLRVNRARKLGIFGENQLKIRENFQISLDNKINITDNIIDNNSGFSGLAKQVADIFSYIVDNG